jgi:hypothetical protein
VEQEPWYVWVAAFGPLVLSVLCYAWWIEKKFKWKGRDDDDKED